MRIDIEQKTRLFKDEICSSCKNQCDRGMSISLWDDRLFLRCFDFLNDTTKQPIQITRNYKISEKEKNHE